FFFSSRRRHTRFSRDWSSDVCSSDLSQLQQVPLHGIRPELVTLAQSALSSRGTAANDSTRRAHDPRKPDPHRAGRPSGALERRVPQVHAGTALNRSEEHTSELQSRENLVCRLLLEKKKR